MNHKQETESVSLDEDIPDVRKLAILFQAVVSFD
jgi:hypothetical protein